MVVMTFSVFGLGPCLSSFADVCSLPPSKMDLNPYSRQNGLGSDNPYNMWKRDSHAFNPYSSTPSPDENIYHEHMQESDEPGHWVVDTFQVNGWANLALGFDAHVKALTVDAKGKPYNFGGYLVLTNNNEAPIYFNYTTHVLNDKLMPGESRKINLGIYQPKNKPPLPYTVPLTIKYWKKTGQAPTRCPDWKSFYSGAATNGQAHYDAVKKYIQWTSYTLSVRGGSSGSESESAGPMRRTTYYSPHETHFTWSNTSNSVVLMECDGDSRISSFAPGQIWTSENEHDPGDGRHSGWLAVTFTCRIAVAPADKPWNPYTN